MTSVPVPDHGGAGKRLRRLARQSPAVVVLAVLWTFLWGNLAWGTFAGGLLVGALVILLLPLPTVGARATVRPWPATVLFAGFVKDLVAASFQIAWMVLRPGPLPRGGIVAVRAHPAPDLLFTMTAELTTLVPGALVVEADRERAILYVHVLDLDRMGGPEGVRAETLKLEERVLRAFAAEADLPPALARGREEQP